MKPYLRIPTPEEWEEEQRTRKCVVCDCELNDDNRAQWEDHCEDCETKVFKFYGALGPIGESEE